MKTVKNKRKKMCLCDFMSKDLKAYRKAVRGGRRSASSLLRNLTAEQEHDLIEEEYRAEDLLQDIIETHCAVTSRGKCLRPSWTRGYDEHTPIGIYRGTTVCKSCGWAKCEMIQHEPFTPIMRRENEDGLDPSLQQLRNNPLSFLPRPQLQYLTPDDVEGDNEYMENQLYELEEEERYYDDGDGYY